MFNCLIDRYDKMDDVSVEKLMVFIPGPDFPTAGMIIGEESIVSNMTGKGDALARVYSMSWTPYNTSLTTDFNLCYNIYIK